MIELRWLQPAAADEQACLGLLDEAERSRAWRFHHACDRLAYAAAHALLRTLLGEIAGEAPRDWRFARSETGKPRLADAAPDLRFSLSHARGVVACAVAPGVELGVDVEPLADVPDALALARTHFSAEEADGLQALADSARSEAFVQLWTLKEAALKAGGVGMGGGIAEPRFDVGLLASSGDRVSPVRLGAWAFRRYRLPGPSALALAVPVAAGSIPVRLLQANRLQGAWPRA